MEAGGLIAEEDGMTATRAEWLLASVLGRKALVYVRQSTQAQVETNTESQRRQYELVEVARGNGFKDVSVIDVRKFLPDLVSVLAVIHHVFDGQPVMRLATASLPGPGGGGGDVKISYRQKIEIHAKPLKLIYFFERGGITCKFCLH